MKSLLKLSLFTLICIIIMSSCQSYSSFTQGYVVMMNGDTIHGILKDRDSGTFEKLYTQIKFRSEEKKFYRLSPNEIQAYSKGNQVFQSLAVEANNNFFSMNTENTANGERKFFQLLYSGYCSVYKYEYEDDSRIESRYYFKKANDNTMQYFRTGLLGPNRKSLIEYFADCISLQIKIDRKEITEPIEMARYYNNSCHENKNTKFEKQNSTIINSNRKENDLNH